MTLVLDACVLYPTLMREMLLGAAGLGCFDPIWSPRILEEWARAAARGGAVAEMQARGEIALLRAAHPKAERPEATALEAGLWLPDAADIHVLALAIAERAQAIVTLNARDFPRPLLAEHGLECQSPDALLLTCWQHRPQSIAALAAATVARARAAAHLSDSLSQRQVLKKARLPRLGKALQRFAG